MGCRILLVEDDDESRLACRVLLEQQGHTVEAQTTGAEGLVAALRSPPEVIILDLELPGMDGCAVARALREQGSDRPFLVALTGHGRETDRNRALEAGFDVFLLKPCDPDVLLEVVAGARLARRRG